MTWAPRAARGLALGRLAVAAQLVIRPHRTGRVAAGGDVGVPPAWLVRILGGRMALQSCAELAYPVPAVLMASAAVDALHAASMGVAAIDPRYRRAAAISAAIAVTSAAVGAGISALYDSPSSR